MIRRLIVVLTAVGFLAACGGGDGSSNGDSAGDDGSEQRGSPSTCVAECPDGQFCFNGVCAIGCNSDGDCADNQYCATETDRLCHNKEVQECADTSDCAGDQVCNQGLCAAKPDTGECEPSPDGKDGCGKYAVCVEEQGGNRCYSLPKCGADGTCPTGQAGAVCNKNYIPNKAEICLLGLCKDSSHCPDNWKCTKATQSQELGTCLPNAGGTGSTCMDDSDCMSGSCVGAQAGFPGACE